MIQRVQVFAPEFTDAERIFEEKLRRLNGFLDRVAAHDAQQGRRQASAVLVFANTRDAVAIIHSNLRTHAGVRNKNRTKGARREMKGTAVGFGATMLHGQLPQARRANAWRRLSRANVPYW